MTQLTKGTRLDRWLQARVPAGQVRLVHRAVIGYALFWTLVRTSFWIDQAQLSEARRAPVGVLSWFQTVLTPTAVLVLVAITILAGVLALRRAAWIVSAPSMAVGFLVLTTHGNGWGQVLHTENLVALHLLVLAAGPAAPAASARDVVNDTAEGWPLRVLGLVTVATYVLAGMAKVRYGGTEWLSGHTLQNLVAHDNLRKQLLGDYSSPIAPLLVRAQWLFGPAAIASVVVELLAPIALFNRKTAAVWSMAAWSFHLAVLGVLAVLFLYPLLGVAFLPLLLAYQHDPLSGIDDTQALDQEARSANSS